MLMIAQRPLKFLSYLFPVQHGNLVFSWSLSCDKDARAEKYISKTISLYIYNFLFSSAICKTYIIHGTTHRSKIDQMVDGSFVSRSLGHPHRHVSHGKSRTESCFHGKSNRLVIRLYYESSVCSDYLPTFDDTLHNPKKCIAISRSRPTLSAGTIRIEFGWRGASKRR